MLSASCDTNGLTALIMKQAWLNLGTILSMPCTSLMDSQTGYESSLLMCLGTHNNT